MATGIVTELLAGLVSPPPETVAVFVKAEAFDPTLTVIVIGGYDWPAGKASVLLQVTDGIATVQAHPVPIAAVGVRPGWSVSVTVMPPAVGPAPPFDTVMVNSPPACPCVNGGLSCVF
jgi:hypothetical protein